MWCGLLCVAVAAAFAVRMLAEWRSPVSTTSGLCGGAAVTFHPGLAAQVSGGELSAADREAFSAECRTAGAAAWDAGVASGQVATVAGLVGAASLVVALRRAGR